MTYEWDGRYPVRVRILDVAGDPLPIPIPGVVCATPAASVPHIGKVGTARKIKGSTVRIELDDGGAIYGHECSWAPIGPVPAEGDA